MMHLSDHFKYMYEWHAFAFHVKSFLKILVSILVHMHDFKNLSGNCCLLFLQDVFFSLN